MASFIVRVELHNARYEDYLALHAAMAVRGFSRTILGSNGENYHLPTAEYDITTTATAEQVRQAADSAATTTGKAHGVLVAQYSSCLWSGLPKAS
jgi:hypothetical protein